MRVGLTFDLRDHYLAAGYSAEDTAEFDNIETIDSLGGALERLGLEVDRIGTVRQLAQRLVAGERWELVFNIAEGLKGVGREAQVPALLDAYDIPYTFSDTMVMALALHKGMAKRVVRDCGVPTAPFAVVETMADLAAVELPFPLFAKPIAEGTGKGVTSASRVASATALRKLCRQLLERYRQPVLVETFLPGREFTVGIIGTGASAESVAVMAADDTRLDGRRREHPPNYRRSSQAARKARSRAARARACRRRLFPCRRGRPRRCYR